MFIWYVFWIYKMFVDLLDNCVINNLLSSILSPVHSIFIPGIMLSYFPIIVYISCIRQPIHVWMYILSFVNWTFCVLYQLNSKMNRKFSPAHCQPLTSSETLSEELLGKTETKVWTALDRNEVFVWRGLGWLDERRGKDSRGISTVKQRGG